MNSTRVPMLNDPRARRWLFWGAFTVCFGLAVFCRFYRLGAESMWLDETTTWERASLPIPELIEDSRRRLHNPLYFLLIHAVLPFGDSEEALRLPSAIAGALTLGLTALLGHVCGGPRAALAALILLAINPLRLRYDQEARMYAQYGLAVVLMLCGLMWLLRHPQVAAQPLWRRPEAGVANAKNVERARALSYLALFLGGTLVLYTHNTGTLVHFCLGLSVLLTLPAFPRASRMPWLLNFGLLSLVIVLAYLPWLSSLLYQTQRIHGHFWAEFPDARELRNVTLALYFFGGYRATLMLLAPLLTVASVCLLFRRPRVLVPLLVCAFLTPLLILLISLKRPIFIDRLMLWVVIPYAVLLAMALARLPARLYALTLAALLVVGGDQLVDRYYGRRHKPDFRAAITDIARRPQAVSLLVGGREDQQFRYYTQRKDAPIVGVEFHDLTKAELGVRDIPALIRGHREVFLVRRRAWPTFAPALATLRRAGRFRDHRNYGHRLHVYRFDLARRSGQ